MTRQAEFRAALLDAATPVPAGLTDGAGRPAGRRYSVYRNNVAVSLREALATGFPAVAKLIGQENFAHVAGLYLRQAPPVSPVMQAYGECFADFLDGFAALSHIGYLPDVARLEMALRRSYHAADHKPVPATALQALDEARLMASRLTLAPSVQIVRSTWPIVSIWRYTLEPGQPKPQAGAQDAIVLRPEFDPAPHVLPKGGAAFADALSAGASFGAAVEAAGDGFDLAQMLTLLFSHGAVAEIAT